MTKDELTTHVWHELPITKHMLGRRRIDRIVARTLKAWPAPVLAQCDDNQTEVVGRYLARGVERQERAEYGMGVFAMLILSAIVGEIVKILIRRWLENRTEMMELCTRD